MPDEIIWLGETSPVEPYGNNPTVGLMNTLAATEDYISHALQHLKDCEEYSDPNVELKRPIANLENALLNTRELRKILLKLRSDCVEGMVFKGTAKAVIDLPITIRGSDLEALL